MLYNVRHINKQEESSYYNAVINNDTIDINSSLKENSNNNEVKVISEKEFNYKMVYYYTFFMLMDRFKSIGCWIGAETPA